MISTSPWPRSQSGYPSWPQSIGDGAKKHEYKPAQLYISKNNGGTAIIKDMMVGGRIKYILNRIFDILFSLQL